VRIAFHVGWKKKEKKKKKKGKKEEEAKRKILLDSSHLKGYTLEIVTAK